MISVGDMMHTMKTTQLRQDEYLDLQTELIFCRSCGTPRQKRLVFDGQVYLPRTLCRCRQEQQEAREAARQQQEREWKISRLRSTGLPDPQLQQCTFENDRGFNPEMEKIKRYVNHWEQMQSRAMGLLLTGGVGTGKTYMAACAANALIDREVPVLMTNLARVLNTLTGLYSGDRNQYIDSMNQYPLLILDDLGMERSSEFALEQIYNVIDSRYRSRRSLIVTTNLTLEQMHNPQDIAHSRIYSRVLERCIPILVNRENIRTRNAARNLAEARKLLEE